MNIKNFINGRSGRLTYLIANILIYIFIVLTYFLLGLSEVILAESELLMGICDVMLSIIMLVLLILGYIYSMRRFHDINQSGWNAILLLVPLINIIGTVVLIFKKGSKGENRFGLPPQ